MIILSGACLEHSEWVGTRARKTRLSVEMKYSVAYILSYIYIYTYIYSTDFSYVPVIKKL